MVIDTPLPLEQTDPELGELIRWRCNEGIKEVNECETYVRLKIANPYEVCEGCGKKNRWCNCVVN